MTAQEATLKYLLERRTRMDLELETSSHESCCVAEGTSAISLFPFALLTVGTAFVETHRRIRERRLQAFLSFRSCREYVG